MVLRFPSPRDHNKLSRLVRSDQIVKSTFAASEALGTNQEGLRKASTFKQRIQRGILRSKPDALDLCMKNCITPRAQRSRFTPSHNLGSLHALPPCGLVFFLLATVTHVAPTEEWKYGAPHLLDSGSCTRALCCITFPRTWRSGRVTGPV